MSNFINFYPIEHSAENVLRYAEKPKRGSNLVSEWFKDAPRFHNADSELKATDTFHNLTVRHCMPFLDSMTAGYFLTTWTDIYVKRENGKPVISYDNINAINEFGYGIIQYQEYFKSYVPTMPGFDPFVYAWSTYWRVKTPEGVSCLFTQPMNRTDLPFITLSGVVDTDNWNGSDVLNFALKENFEGVIPKGTPYVQIIPFVRNEWDHNVFSSKDESMIEERNLVLKLRHKDLKSGYYRDNLWKTKKYL